MATKTKKKAVKKAAPVAAKRRPACECTPRECIRENSVLKMHVTVITILSVVVCMLVAVLVLVALKN